MLFFLFTLVSAHRLTLTLTQLHHQHSARSHSCSYSRHVIGKLTAFILFTLVSAHRLTVTVTQLHHQQIVSIRVSSTHNHTHAHRLTVTPCHRQIKCCFFVHLSQCSQTHAHAYTITSPTQCTITLILMLTPCHRYIKCCYFFSPWSVLTDSRSRLHNYITNTLSASESAALTITLTLTDSRSRSRLVIGRLNAVIFFTLVSAHRLTVTVTQLHLEHIVSFRVSNTHNHTHAHRLTLTVTLCHRQIKCCYFFSP